MTLEDTVLHDCVARAAVRQPDSVAVTFGEERLTWGELERQANAVAQTLVSRGIVRGDRVVIVGSNSLEVIISFWATLKANAVAVILSPQTPAAKLTWYLRDTGARAVLAEGRLEAVSRALEAVEGQPLSLAWGSPSSRALPWGAALTARGTPAREQIESDLAALIYTSGSSGEPKGVMLTHRNMLAASASIARYLELAADDVLLCALPLAFDYGLYQVILAARAGARLVLEPSFAFPQPVLRRMVTEGVTTFPGVPTWFSMLESLPPTAAFPALRRVTSTGAALMPRHIATIKVRFPGTRIFSMYGLTECKRCTYLPPAAIDQKPGSVGLAIPNTELWLVDEFDRRVGPNEVGQLVIRGPTVMRGYWNKPEATAKKLRPGPLPGELVLYTGDLCRLDDDGFLTFVARMDDVLKSRGEKVAPKEIELALCAIDGVLEAAVVGVPDELLGTAIRAFVAASPNVSLSSDVLRRECQARLEPHLVPRDIVVLDAIPKGPNGKIDKKALHSP